MGMGGTEAVSIRWDGKGILFEKGNTGVRAYTPHFNPGLGKDLQSIYKLGDLGSDMGDCEEAIWIKPHTKVYQGLYFFENFVKNKSGGSTRIFRGQEYRLGFFHR
jgi:hypothetical protein